MEELTVICTMYNVLYNVQCTLGEPVFESFSLSVTVGHTYHNKHIWKVSSQNM